uniref:protein-serine/threonine phosphatase n=2 Tax=Equus asinus TaxID=9793 RepID=A0A9L0JB92_EQUAS
MTCILVCFPGAPRPHEEAIRKEQELDAVLGRRVAELCSSAQEPPSLNTVFRTLASEDIHDLPPGGGVYCKAAVIADAYSQLCQASGERREVRTLCLECYSQAHVIQPHPFGDGEMEVRGDKGLA